ncbi:ATP-binding protein [Streptomyces clavuligerus]|uniref:Putative large ATP-binding protein n=1 Tax=Streptomyces clavuligerus TaxID=1901 RepID=E2Q8G7_STRCL|nr:ATP-binding protein [Streptomyces clavuligerus]EFG07455.1 Putative large ATP-binding protein [Streptomyces clavuligerus]QCS07091.1 NACHT domain-containing protein [Streptomyces clavuligerus]
MWPGPLASDREKGRNEGEEGVEQVDEDDPPHLWVHIETPDPDAPYPSTTGLLLTPEYVLACASLLGGARSFKVRWEGRRTGDHTCRVEWTSAPETDAVLLRCLDDPLRYPEELGTDTLCLGRLVSDTPLPGWELHDSGEPPVSGSILPPTDPGHGRILLDRPEGLPIRLRPEGPLFAGPVLIGLTSTKSPRQDDRHLAYVPIETIRKALHTETEIRLPPPRNITGSRFGDVRYEDTYATALRAHYRKLEVFGIDELGVSEATWDLDTAYLSLEATRLAEDDSPRYAPDGPSEAPTTTAHRPQRVEDLLGRQRRTLLRGEAGAGKTTLVWWLAAHAARGTLPDRLDALNGLVPFVVPLRSVHAHGRGFPAPDALVHAAGLSVGTPPEGWAERVLASGRALLLVDGFDELPRAHRADARRWLAGLLRRYGATRVLATVRPGAVEAKWLADEGFADLLLLPMSDGDIEMFIAAWHRAARLEYAALDTARAGAEAERLDGLAQRLGRELANNRVLRDLARTPLLCAVICALHRKRRGALPHTRWELYRATLDMLLGNRDRGRGIEAPEGFALGVEEHKLLLQHIAVWLVRGGRVQLTPGEAERQIERAMAAMPQVRAQGTPRQALVHLLNRSGLLQQRTGDTIQFIHRTFQDYLAAKEFAETGSVGELLQNAGDELWRDVVRLAVGHFDRTHVSRLISELIALGDRSPEPLATRSLHLLAGYCAVSSVFLDGRIRAKAEHRVRALMPPQDKDEVRELASFGSAVLPLLPGPSGDGTADALVVETFAQVGDETAIEPLARFTGDDDKRLRRALVAAWRQLPAERYARQVLARVDLTGIDLEVHTAEQFRQIHHCGPVPLMTVEGPHPAEELDTWLPRTGLRHLDVIDNPLLTRLDPVRERRSIKTLGVYLCPALETFDDLADRAFASLAVDPEHLDLPGGLPRVRTLMVVGDTEPRYGALARWSTVQRLVAAAPVRFAHLMERAARLPRLTELSVQEFTGDAPGRAVAAPGITRLTLDDAASRLDPADIARLFPGLRTLRLRPFAVDEYTVDLTPLRDLPDLMVYLWHRRGARIQVTGGELFGERLEIVVRD